MPKNREHYIQVDKDLMDDPLFLCTARKLIELQGDDPDSVDATWQARGRLMLALFRLWCYADTYIRDDNTIPMGVREVDSQVGLRGFCDVMPDRWLQVIDDDTIRLPGYCEKNNIVSRRKRKAVKAAREKTRRDKERAGHVPTTRQPRGGNVLPNTNTNTRDKESSLREPKKASRLPSNAVLTDQYREVGIEEGLTDVERVFAMFVDHFSAAPGEKGRKVDWLATWRNWCRREADWRKSRPAGTRGAWSTRPTQESALAAIEAAMRESTTDDRSDDGYIRVE